MVTSQASAFRGFAPGARAFLAELAANQTSSWFEANKGRCAVLLRQPMRELVITLDQRFNAAPGQRLGSSAASIPLNGHPDHNVLPLSLGRRSGNPRPRYRDRLTAIMTTTGNLQCQASLVIEFGKETSSIKFGFHNVVVWQARELRASMDTSPQHWSAVEEILKRSDLQLGDGLRAKVDYMLSRRTRRNSELVDRNLFVEAEFSSARFARPEIVDWIVLQASAASPFLQLGTQSIPHVIKREAFMGVTSLG